GKTALHLACEHKYSATHIDAIKLLLRHSADLDANDDNGNTPLHDAAAEGVEEAVKLLLDYGAEVNVPNDDGDFPLHSSTRWIQADVPQLLLDRGADP
ncbi:ankyrin repeat protein, partial [Pyrenochaeta sp. MPI-SDFR-AT-0127]